MHRFAAIFCQDQSSLATLKVALSEVRLELVTCRSHQQAMEIVLGGRCAALIVDFDLPGALEVMKTAALLVPPQKPLLLAMSDAWPGTGQAFQSGAHRILYKPLQLDQVKDAFESSRASKKKSRKAPRYLVESLVYLDFENGTVPAIGLNLSEQGMAIRASRQINPCSNVAFRCVLPGSSDEVHGHANVIWADPQGRAGIFFSRLSPSASKHLNDWLRKHGGQHAGPVRRLLPASDTAVFATPRS